MKEREKCVSVRGKGREKRVIKGDSACEMKREGERKSVCMCVLGRESVCVCVCRERERERVE